MFDTKIVILGLWAVINNAGICVCGEFEWLTWEQCEAMVNVNLLGSARLTKAALPLIKPNKGIPHIKIVLPLDIQMKKLF